MEEHNNIKPPRWADDFLSWICAPSFIDEVQGDLHEAFHRRHMEHGASRARILFVIDVFRSISLKTINRSFYGSFKSLYMVNSYFKSGWRNFLKYKSYSIINLFGLSVGFASALLLFLIVRYENSFDLLHKDVAQIYRVGNKFMSGGTSDRIVTPQVSLMDQEYPDIVGSSRFLGHGDIMNAGSQYVRSSYHFVDPGFADIFDFPMLRGNMKKALSAPGQVVLTSKTAGKLFGETDPMGKVILLVNEKKQLVVAGVVDDPPANSTLQFEALVPWSSAPKWLDVDQVGNWYNTFMEGYIKIDARTSKEALEEKLIAFKDAHFLEERKADWRVLLLPMEEEHYRLTGNKRMIAILSVMAGAILLISCINFTNLSIAQTLRRTKEIGLRRVLGSIKWQIALQFVAESGVAFALSITVGILATWLALPYVNDYYGFSIDIDPGSIGSLLMFLAGACLLAIMSSTLGTAMALSRLKPVNALKGVFKGASSGEYLRRTLLVVQFAASIVLIIGTTVVWQQTNFMKSQDLKFDNNNVVVVDTWSELFRDQEKAKSRLASLREELRHESVVASASFTSAVPGEYNESYNIFQALDSTADKRIHLRKAYVGHNFFETFGMTLVMGRDFSAELESDKAAVIINETAMRELGWRDLEDKALLEGGNGDEKVHVIGVVKDYFYQSLKREIQPVIHIFNPEATDRLVVRLKTDRVQDGLALLEKKWDMLDAYESFDFRFVDKTFDNLYKEQERLGATASFFSAIAVTIACLGLLSITSYAIRLRRKEVGIRKVLGASIRSIVINLSLNYGIMIVVGFLIACPVVYYLANIFLEDFAYRIALSPVTFGVAGLLVFVLALTVIVAITGKAAMENPVKSLKEEG